MEGDGGGGLGKILLKKKSNPVLVYNTWFSSVVLTTPRIPNAIRVPRLESHVRLAVHALAALPRGVRDWVLCSLALLREVSGFLVRPRARGGWAGCLGR